MKKIFFLFLIVFVSTLNAIGQNKYFIRLTDKNNNGFSSSNPQAFLSQRSINRRANQNISITNIDLPLTSTYVQGIENAGAIVLAKTKWLNGVVVQCDSTTLNAIQQLPYVLSSERVMKKSKTTFNKFIEPDFPLQQNILRTASLDYGFSGNQATMIHVDYLHNNGFTGGNQLIAVLDAGFYKADSIAAFDSLRNRNGVVATKDFVDGDNFVYEADGHGTAVLSCIAGNVPGQIVGTAPDANFILLRTEDSFTENIVEEYFWAAGAEYADSMGADIISSSLGYTTFDGGLNDHSYADMNGNICPATIAADIAASVGIFVAVSAGNSGNNSWNYISTPSDGDSVMAVGAVDGLGVYASFSSNGPSSDGEVKPNVSVQGAGTVVAYSGGAIGPGNGTSFSCPVLAGAASCLWQAFPNKTNMQIFNAIQESASIFSAPDTNIGYGIPNFELAASFLSVAEGSIIGNGVLSFYPNPFSEEINIQYSSKEKSNLNLELFDVIGRIIFSKEENVNPGVRLINFPLKNNLSKGFYFLRISSDNYSKVLKLER